MLRVAGNVIRVRNWASHAMPVLKMPKEIDGFIIFIAAFSSNTDRTHDSLGFVHFHSQRAVLSNILTKIMVFKAFVTTWLFFFAKWACEVFVRIFLMFLRH